MAGPNGIVLFAGQQIQGTATLQQEVVVKSDARVGMKLNALGDDLVTPGLWVVGERIDFVPIAADSALVREPNPLETPTSQHNPVALIGDTRGLKDAIDAGATGKGQNRQQNYAAR